jgi:hypothetical protein
MTSDLPQKSSPAGRNLCNAANDFVDITADIQHSSQTNNQITGRTSAMTPLKHVFSLAARYWRAKKCGWLIERAHKDWRKSNEKFDAEAKRLKEAPRELPQRLKNLMLVTASAAGETKAVTELVAARADVHAMHGVALVLAVANQHPDTVAELRKAGADIHAINGMAIRLAKEQQNPTMIATLCGPIVPAI